mgnify:CR=1 FL=1
MATTILKRVHNPVRVRSHAGEYRETIRGKEYFVPGYDGIVMERSEARDFLSTASPRTDAYGNITPKALTFECEYCNTQYPPRLHPCFTNNVEAIGILDQPEECNLCGKAIHEQGGMDRHITKDHKGVRVKKDDKNAPSEDVLALKSEIADMKLLVARLLADKQRSPDEGVVVVDVGGTVLVASEAEEVPPTPANVPKSIRELGERFQFNKRDNPSQ